MMTVFIQIIALTIGFALLVRGANAFVDAAGEGARRMGVPPLVVGLTVVALGTSAPEVAVSLASSARGTADMALAGVFGSNIVNTLVVMGVTALCACVPVQRSAVRVEMPLVVGATALLLALCVFDGRLGRMDALLMLGLLVAYMVVLVRGSLAQARQDREQVHGQVLTPAECSVLDGGSAGRLAVRCLLGIVAIFVGSQFCVESAAELARLAGVSDRVAGLTVVAVGTSLPELAASVAAARKGQGDLAVGNVVGSSLLNILFVLGVSGTIAPVPFSSALLVDGIAALAATGMLWMLGMRRRSLGKGVGAALLACYGVYLCVALAP